MICTLHLSTLKAVTSCQFVASELKTLKKCLKMMERFCFIIPITGQVDVRFILLRMEICLCLRKYMLLGFVILMSSVEKRLNSAARLLIVNLHLFFISVLHMCHSFTLRALV
jgi:hypothetical protein